MKEDQMKRKRLIKLVTEKEKDDYYKKNGLRKKMQVKQTEGGNEEEEEEEEEGEEEDQEDNDQMKTKRLKMKFVTEEEQEEDRKHNLRKTIPVIYNDVIEWEEEEEEEEEDEEDQEDNEQPGPSKKNTHTQRTQEHRLLPVTCGNKKGILHKDKLERGEECIECEGRWFSPPAFEDFGGKGSSKKWKASIFYKDKALQVLFEKGSLTTQGYKRRGNETAKPKRIVSPHCESENSSEESEMQFSEETEEDDVKDDDWQPGSDEVVLETEGGEEEYVGAENEAEVVDSEVEKSKEEEDKMEKGEREDEEDVADNDNNSVFEETEIRSNLSTLEKSALQKKAKVIIKRLPQAKDGCQSKCTEHPVEDYCCKPLDEKAQSEEEREEHNVSQTDDPSTTAAQDVPPSAGGSGEQLMQSNKGKNVQRENKGGTRISPRCLSATATSPSDINPDIVNRSDNTGSVSSHTANRGSSPFLLVTETDTGFAGDRIDDWENREDREHIEMARSEASQPCTPVNIRDVSSSTVPTQKYVKDEILQATSSSTNPSELVECKYESPGHTDASTSDPAQSQVMRLRTRLPQTIQLKDSSHSSEMMEGPFSGPSTSTDLDTIDLDQLKREKIKRQLKVLKLQEEYYTLKIKDLKK